MRTALYARYSSDNQSDASIEDQFRLCRLHAEKQGWAIIDSYSDRAISGASLIRSGIQALMEDAQKGKFDVILTESIDRLSRDQEDIAGLYKRMRFAGIRIVTLSEGEINELHIGLKGTMGALFLKDLADKTRRGLRGRVENGKSGGGNAYGYDVVRKLDSNGEAIRGDRTINDPQATIIRRIFMDFAAGKSPKRIAFELNREGVPGPTGADWGFSTINGNYKRGTGILNNEMYIGKLVWNRQRYIKDPDTGKRQARLNPPEEWIVQEVPELRLIEQDLWDAVKARQEEIKRPRGDERNVSENHFRDRRRPRYLLSGLTKCGCCGGGFSMISATHVGCSTARNKGTCTSRTSIRREALEERVLNALRHHLMDPALFKIFCEEFTTETNRLRIDARTSITAAEDEIKRIDRDLDRLLDLILKGAAADKINARMVEMEKRKKDLEAFLAETDEPPTLLHPEMASFYRQKVEALHSALQGDIERDQLQAAEALRALISDIIVTPGGAQGEMTIEVSGDLAGILTIAANGRGASKKPGTPSSTSPNGPKAADLGLKKAIQQVEMVAGAGNYRYRHSLVVPV